MYLYSAVAFLWNLSTDLLSSCTQKESVSLLSLCFPLNGLPSLWTSLLPSHLPGAVWSRGCLLSRIATWAFEVAWKLITRGENLSFIVEFGLFLEIWGKIIGNSSLSLQRVNVYMSIFNELTRKILKRVNQHDRVKLRKISVSSMLGHPYLRGKQMTSKSKILNPISLYKCLENARIITHAKICRRTLSFGCSRKC